MGTTNAVLYQKYSLYQLINLFGIKSYETKILLNVINAFNESNFNECGKVNLYQLI